MVQLRKVVLEPHGGQRPKLAVVTSWLRQLPRFWPHLIIPETIQVKNVFKKKTSKEPSKEPSNSNSNSNLNLPPLSK
jgi:hypothetical protein